MATAKRKPRNTTRSTRRSAPKKSSGSSVASILALGAIVAVGAVSLWAVSQHQSPQAAIAHLFNGTATSSRPAVERRAANVAAEKKPIAEPRQQSAQTNRVSPAPIVPPVPPSVARPSIGLTAKPAAAPAPYPTARPSVAQNAAPVATGKPERRVAAANIPAAANQNLPPRGVNRPDTTPTMVYAKQRLTVHKTAWDKSPSMGEIEKGRELRSYGQTGKWHRVVVPATDMIGWVHQDKLVIVKQAPKQSAQAQTPTRTLAPAPLTTGSVKPAAATKPTAVASKPASNRPVPQRGIGE